MGSRTDLLYCWNGNELGGAEFGKQQTSQTTDKYLDDGSVKLPNTLKEMFCLQAERRPDLINKLQVVGIIVMGEIYIFNY